MEVGYIFINAGYYCFYILIKIIIALCKVRPTNVVSQPNRSWHRPNDDKPKGGGGCAFIQ